MTRIRPQMARNERSRASSNAQRDGSPRGKRMKEKVRTKPATDDTMKDAEKPPYKPTPIEAKALDAYRAAREREDRASKSRSRETPPRSIPITLTPPLARSP